MKIKYRMMILIILTIIFLIASPILLLWTLGYRWNPKKYTIQKTGLLVVQTKPEAADVYLNNIKQKKTTPAKIKNLLPDTYNLKIEKESRISYETQIEIKSGLASFVEDVILFKQNLPIAIDEEEATAVFGDILMKKPLKTREEEILSKLPYKNYLLIADEPRRVFKNNLNNKLLIVDKDEKIIFDDYGQNAVFHPTKNEFIVYDDFEINLYNPEKREKIFINRSSQKIKNVFFLKDTNYVIYALEDGIYAAEIKPIGLTRTITKLATFNSIENAVLQADENAIYISGTIGKKQGFFKLSF